MQAHLQHYAEPPAPGTPAPTKALGTTLLPLGPGTLTLNPAGVPIVVVCTRADQMDSVGDEMGMKGGSWEERTDWIQQVLRTICLSYGAALFYTSQTQPATYTLLRDYLVHRLYTTPGPQGEPVARYPFAHRANVLDRDAVLVPSGWDSWGKINVLREGFDLQRVHNAWESSINRSGQSTDADEEAIDDLWTAMVPDTERPKKANDGAISTTSEAEQAFLSRQLEALMKDPNRDPRASFRHAVNSAAANEGEQRFGGVVGPMGAGGLNLPGVEKAMAEMEGGDDVKERFARIARRVSTRPEVADRRPKVLVCRLLAMVRKAARPCAQGRPGPHAAARCKLSYRDDELTRTARRQTPVPAARAASRAERGAAQFRESQVRSNLPAASFAAISTAA